MNNTIKSGLKEKLVNLKIHQSYKDMLKNYCEINGLKMYAKIEQLIQAHCNPISTKKKPVDYYN